jgi:hypothetical protein
MNIPACYRVLLGLYPKGFRQQFSDEMLHVFAQRALEQLAGGRAVPIIFLVREFFSVGKGALTMWMEKILPMKQKQQIDTCVTESTLSTAELRKRREEAIHCMVQAIATHDFAGARRYSEEEIRLNALLRERTETAGSQHAGAA